MARVGLLARPRPKIVKFDYDCQDEEFLGRRPDTRITRIYVSLEVPSKKDMQTAVTIFTEHYTYSVVESLKLDSNRRYKLRQGWVATIYTGINNLDACHRMAVELVVNGILVTSLEYL
jgi:hypothetical protein